MLTTASGQTIDCSEYVARTIDDSDFTTVDLPYDWSIRQDFRQHSSACCQGAYLDGGIGVFRKTLTIRDLSRRVVLFFDGVFMDAEVYVNGTKVGENHWWNPFSFDITDSLEVGDNTIAVWIRVDQPNSRWYSGAGITRDVYIVYCEPEGVTGIDQINITTPNISSEISSGYVTTMIRVKTTGVDSVNVQIIDSSGRVVGRGDGRGMDLTVGVKVNDPDLWSCDHPNLYYAKITVGNRVCTTERFGYRWFEYSSSGMKMNGEPFKVNGVCMHEDTNCLGMEASKSADVWKLRKLKECGVNAIRTCHNPFSRKYIEACDELGILVCYEMYDCWFIHKESNYYDFSRYFDDYYKGVLKNSIVRDVNSPAVFMWVVGNEIQFGQMTSEQMNSYLSSIRDTVRTYDTSRPITIGNSEITQSALSNTIDYVDVVGCNYADSDEYTLVERYSQDKAIIGTEMYSSVQTRGIYVQDSDNSYCTSYDTQKVNWGDYFWGCYKSYYVDHPEACGGFAWTGFDYLGEPTPFYSSSYFPTKSSQFGIVDTAGFEKDAFYMFQSVWSSAPMTHVLPMDWDSWTSGETVEVDVYSNQPSVELFLNGTSLGKMTSKDSMYKYEYSVSYEPGVLSCVAYDSSGNPVATDVVRTSTKTVSRILMNSSLSAVSISERDYAFIQCELQDENGVAVARSEDSVTFTISGGEIYGTDNGKPKDGTNMKSPTRNAFCGKVLCVARPYSNVGVMTITATLTENTDVSSSITISREA